jgi:hypothetical protein
MNAPQCNRTWGCTTNSSNWAVNLTQFQWQMQYDRRSTQIVMENVTLVVPQTEFQASAGCWRVGDVIMLSELQWMCSAPSYSTPGSTYFTGCVMNFLDVG